MGSLRGKVVSGARAAVLMDGKKVGWATSIRVRHGIDYRPVRVLDKLEVDTHEPTGYTVSVTLGTLTIIGENMKTAGYMPGAGREEGSRLLNVLDRADISLSINDRQIGRPEWIVVGVRVGTEDINVDAGNLSGTNVECVATECFHVSEL